MTLRKLLKKIASDEKVFIVHSITNTTIFRGLAMDIKLQTYLYSEYNVIRIGSDSSLNAIFIYVIGGPHDE